MKWYKWWPSVVIVIAWTIAIIGIARSAEPQSAIIEFTSAEDLTARVDSVCAVRDTMWKETNLDVPPGCRVDSVIWEWGDPMDTSSGHFTVYYFTVYSRTLAGVTVVKEPIHPYIPVNIPYDGTAGAVLDMLDRRRGGIPDNIMFPYDDDHGQIVPGKAVVWFVKEEQ